MNWTLHCADGRLLELGPGTDLAVGAGPGCGLRLRAPAMPARLATIESLDGEVWLHVQSADVPVAVNGRPVRSLSRMLAGDRACFGASCVDLLGVDPAAGKREGPPLEAFTLRVRGGPGSGRLHHGPVATLGDAGHIVAGGSSQILIELVDGRVVLRPGGGSARVNGHVVTDEVRLANLDQVQVGDRRYLLETVSSVVPDAVTVRLPAMTDIVDEMPERLGDLGALWWLIAIAALIAVLVASLLYFHG